MAIELADIKTYRSAVVDDTSANGGRVDDSALILTNTVGSMGFPDVYDADRAAGTNLWRKQFPRFEDGDDADATDVDLYIARAPIDGARMYLRPGDFTDTQGAMVSSRYYGGGVLNANASATDTQVDIALLDPAVTQVADGDILYFIDLSTPPYAVIEDAVVSGSPNLGGSILTIDLAAGLANNLTSGQVYVAAAWRTATLDKTLSGYVDGSAGGTLDTGQIVLKNTGGVYQVWTVTFTSATAFSLSGDTLGAGLATGTVGSLFQPTNPNTGTPYFEIPAGAWSGTHVASDTHQFTLNMMSTPYWVLRDLPIGGSPSSNVEIDIRGRVHSA